jgi:Na+/phosphate symporter
MAVDPHPRAPQALLDQCAQAEALLTTLARALTHYDRAALERADELAAGVHAAEKRLTADLLRTPWQFVPGHLERIGDQAETILRCARAVVRDGVPFSDRAVAEVEELMMRAAELLRLVHDALETRNRFLLDAVARKGAALGARASAFAETHEARLVEGVCVPQASSLFLAILDSLRGLEWHARQIGQRLRTGASSAA